MNKVTPLVSVIVPNYNHAGFLKKRFDSIINQTYQNIEIILLDDCSTDKSQELLKEFGKESKVSTVILNENNSGSPFRQWQKGFENVKGEFIWIAESDDMADESFLETLIPSFNNESTVLAYCDCHIIDENDTVISDHNTWVDSLHLSKWRNDHAENGIDLLDHFMRYKNVISNASGVVFRKSILDKIDFLSKNFSYTGDWLFFSQVVALGEVSYFSKPLNKWRSHSNSTRRVDSVEREYLRLKETTTVIKYINHTLVKNNKIDASHYSWVIDWWISRYSFKNALKAKYIFIPLPQFLYFTFYRQFVRRTFKEIKNSLYNKVISSIKKIIRKLPYVRSLANEVNVYKKGFPPGHFYSPVVDTDEIREEKERVFETGKQIKGIDLNTENQLTLLKEFKKYYDELDFPVQKSDSGYYYYDNETYSYSDAIFLYSIIRHFKPNQILEVGSGFSSAVMFDINKQFFNSEIKVRNIEPFPNHLIQAFGEDIKSLDLIKKKVQHVGIPEFTTLGENDILFIDSTHVSKTGSDVNYIILEILPSLQKGVLIHFHDIFYPFEYPESWVLDKGFHKNGFGWNEIYLLQAFLTNNDQYRIISFNTYLEETNEKWFSENMPLCLKNKGGSIWLQKVK